MAAQGAHQRAFRPGEGSHGPRGVSVADRIGPERLIFLDLKWDVVEQELARMTAGTRSGPHAENILRDVGVVAARLH